MSFSKNFLQRADEAFLSPEQLLRYCPPLKVSRGMDCCGIVEVSSGAFDLYTKADFIEWLKRTNKYYNRRGAAGLYLYGGKVKDGRARAGILLATSVGTQVEYRTFLKKVGFKEQKTFLNHNTGRYVTVWFYFLKERL